MGRELDGNNLATEKFTDCKEISRIGLFLRFWDTCCGKGNRIRTAVGRLRHSFSDGAQLKLAQMKSPTPRSPIAIGIRIKGFGDGARIKSGFLLDKAHELSSCGSFS
jgi:hypothetical protein